MQIRISNDGLKIRIVYLPAQRCFSRLRYFTGGPDHVWPPDYQFEKSFQKMQLALFDGWFVSPQP